MSKHNQKRRGSRNRDLPKYDDGHTFVFADDMDDIFWEEVRREAEDGNVVTVLSPGFVEGYALAMDRKESKR